MPTTQQICLDHTLAAFACERSAGDAVTRHAFASVSEICHPVTERNKAGLTSLHWQLLLPCSLPGVRLFVSVFFAGTCVALMGVHFPRGPCPCPQCQAPFSPVTVLQKMWQELSICEFLQKSPNGSEILAQSSSSPSVFLSISRFRS